MLRAVAVTVRAQSEAANTATLPTSSSDAARPSIVDRTRPGDHRLGMLVDGPLVECVDLCGLGDPSRGADVLRDRLEPPRCVMR